MPTKIELQWSSAVQKAAADVKKMESEFKALEVSTEDLSAAQSKLALVQFKAESAALKLSDAQKKLNENTNPEVQRKFTEAVLAATASLEKQKSTLKHTEQEYQELQKKSQAYNAVQSQTGSSATQAAVGVTTLGAAINTALGVVGIALAALSVLVGAFHAAEDAANKYGNVKVSEQFNKMNAAVDNTIGLLLDLPIAGKNILEWAGEAAEDITNLAATISYVALQLEVLTGQLTKQEAAAKFAKLANEEYAESAEKINKSVSGATVTYDKFGNKIYTLKDQNQQSSLPGRASGGPVTAGQPYMVGERRPEVFVPKQNGMIYPSVGGGGGSQTIVINVNAGAFLGNRSDAIKLGQRIAPQVDRANRRSATGGIKN